MIFYKYAPLITALSLSLQLSSIEALLTERTSSLALSSSFRSLSKFLPSRLLSMDMTNGAQAKREQTADIQKQVTNNTNNLFPPSKTIFRNPPSFGAGIDERFSQTDEDNGILEQDSTMLTKVHMSYMQLGLLSDLSSDKFGTLDKFEKVKSSAIQQIIPSSAVYEWSPISAHAGGLLNDWTFDLE